MITNLDMFGSLRVRAYASVASEQMRLKVRSIVVVNMSEQLRARNVIHEFSS